tara:strand:- start:645 stop:1364 length:720 start_codon:yes stop_codon:yes gene_type:complete
MKLTLRSLRRIIKEEIYSIHEDNHLPDWALEDYDKDLASVLAADAESELKAIGGDLKDAAFKGVLFDMISGLPTKALRDEFLEKVFTSSDPEVDVSDIAMEDLLDYMSDGTLEIDMDEFHDWSKTRMRSSRPSDGKDRDTKPKVYTGPKGKGMSRYIVTSQVTSWLSEDEANFNASVFYLVDTTNGSKFKIKGSELPKTLPSTEGQIEIFDISPSHDRDESTLVADLNGREFRLIRRDD